MHHLLILALFAYITSFANSRKNTKIVVCLNEVEGELVRSRITGNQSGSPLYLKIRVKDFTSRCERDWRLWRNWRRARPGLLPRPAEDRYHGRSLLRHHFPGHYAGRAPHIHVAVHIDAHEEADGSVHDNTVSMNAQIYFDQDFILQVEKTAPHNANSQPFMLNKDDWFLQQEAAAAFDPFISQITVSNCAQDGLIGYTTVGVNLTEHRELVVADHRPGLDYLVKGS
ncbi:hypothetical protein F5Y19DRAFT_483421 [Xylariaceae sp. FL1651]|nr:hypothetical protein F5Y19DRAFT_483421 [Xylariaceae sp. FL1651]